MIQLLQLKSPNIRQKELAVEIVEGVAKQELPRGGEGSSSTDEISHYANKFSNFEKEISRKVSILDSDISELNQKLKRTKRQLIYRQEKKKEVQEQIQQKTFHRPSFPKDLEIGPQSPRSPAGYSLYFIDFQVLFIHLRYDL